MKEGALFQSFVCILTVLALLLSTIALIRSDANAKELLSVRQRIQEHEIQLSKIPSFSDYLPESGKCFKSNNSSGNGISVVLIEKQSIVFFFVILKWTVANYFYSIPPSDLNQR